MIRPQTCPICRKPLDADAAQQSSVYPFCSERCRQVDLFRWADGKYAIVEPIDPDQIPFDEASGPNDEGQLP